MVPFFPNTWLSAFSARSSTVDSNLLARSIVISIFFALSSVPARTPKAPLFPASFSVTDFTLRKLSSSDESVAVKVFRLWINSLAAAINSGISAVASPISTLRTAPSASGGSLRMPLKARRRVAPTKLRSIVKMLELRNQRASLRATSIINLALPSLFNSMRRTRPIGKPEKVTSIPTTTPSALSATSTSVWVDSNAPRAYSK